MSRAGGRRSRLLVGLAIGALLAGLAAVVAAGRTPSGDSPAVRGGGATWTSTDFPYRSGGVAADRRSVWVSSSGNGPALLSRIDRRDGSITSVEVPLPTVEGIAVGPNGVWVLSGGVGDDLAGAGVVEVDPETMKIVGAVDPAAAGRWTPAAIAVLGPDVWVIEGHEQRLLRVGPDTRRVVEVTPVAASMLSAGGGLLWLRALDDTVAVDPATLDEVARAAIVPEALAAAPDGTVWVVDAAGTLLHLGRTGHVLATAEVTPGPVALAPDDHGVWVADVGGIRRLGLGGDEVPRRFLAAPPRGSWRLAVAGAAVWRTDSAHTVRWGPGPPA